MPGPEGAPAAPLTDASFRWGVYEKALPAGAPWPVLLATAHAAGFQFVEISIDESDARLARLEWSAADRRAFHDALAGAPASVDTMCLSGHRRFPLGSVDPATRGRGFDIMRRAIDFAAEFGLRIVQVAGYDVHYEPSSERTRALWRDGLLRAAEWARGSCVMLAMENVECLEADSVTKIMRYVQAADTPWFQVYPDVGNLAAMGHDVTRELEAGDRHLVGVHLKDTRPGQHRRVPFGQGIVDFDAAFAALARIGFRGPLMVEMWNEGEADPVAAIAAARRWLGDKLSKALRAA